MKKKKLLLLQSLKELLKNTNELWETVSKQKDPGDIEFNYFFGKYNTYLKTGRNLYGDKKMSQFKISISDTEYKKITGLKKVITEMGLFIIFIKSDVENVIDENIRLKKLAIKYKKQASSIQKIS